MSPKDTEGFDRITPRPSARPDEPTGPRPATAAPSGPGPGPAPGPAPAGEPGPPVEEQAAEVVEADLAVLLERASRERDEYLDMSRRVQADFENYKKRMLREQTSMLERAGESLVTALLPVLDAFDLARAHLGDGADSPEGKALLQAAALLDDTLSKEGLERIDEVGVPFDPNVHEAVEHLPVDDGEADATVGSTVVDVLRAGYRWKGRVIRAAMVRVRG